ncbi:MAG: hypothetical protein HYV26_12655 [Candidatus Hydrogenedentes bacterium]|nr:hypothetical protein [Candidatus Hydrogenedentota bacterium]
MKSNLLLAALFALSMAVGSMLGRNLTFLRESEAFYRWIIAAATNQRLFQDANPEYQDKPLFERVAAAAEERLPEVPTPDDQAQAKLVRAVAEPQYQWDVWRLATSPALAAERADFLSYARTRSLQFATGIAYAEAQAGGVNIFNLFFGFRKVAANFVWLQVDRFWHQGMMQRMIPMMRTCVALDPHFVEAYLLGAWHVAYNVTASMLPTPPADLRWDPDYKACIGNKERYYYWAIFYLKDGIRNNPRDYRLYFDLGYSIYSNKMKDYANAVKYLQEAVRVPHDRWVPRMLYHALENNGQYEEALAGWQDYQKRFPESLSGTETAPRFIERNKGLIYEKRGNDAAAAAEKATDPAVAAQKRAETKENRDQAREIWKAMDDPYAGARLLRLQALDMREEGRYLEAIGLLDKARWDSADMWEEASNLIMDIKNQANIALSVSEKKALLRRAEAVQDCVGKPAAAEEQTQG